MLHNKYDAFLWIKKVIDNNTNFVHYAKTSNIIRSFYKVYSDSTLEDKLRDYNESSLRGMK